MECLSQESSSAISGLQLASRHGVIAAIPTEIFFHKAGSFSPPKSNSQLAAHHSQP
jgi:hypothetical protein